MNPVDTWMILGTMAAGFAAMAVWLHGLSQQARNSGESRGEIKVRIDHLEDSLKSFKDQSHEEHAEVHRQLEDIRKDLHELSVKLEKLTARIEAMD